MIFLRLDENVSHRIAEAAKVVGIPQDLKIETAHGQRESGLSDVDWVRRFAQRGRAQDVRVAFSGDGRMRENEAERVALEDAGVVLFFAPGKGFWRELRKEGQAAYFIRWLPKLLEIAKASNPGQQYKLPGSFTPRADLKPLASIASKSVLRPGRPRRDRKLPLLDRS